MTLFNFSLPIGLPLEPAVDAVSDYSPTPARSAGKQPVVDPAGALLEVPLAKLSKADLPGVEQLKEYLAHLSKHLTFLHLPSAKLNHRTSRRSGPSSPFHDQRPIRPIH
jgi:hypothetical protein